MSGKSDRRITFYPSSLPHYRPMASGEGGASETFHFFRFGVSESVKSNVNHGIIGKLGTFRDLLTLFRVTWRFSLFSVTSETFVFRATWSVFA